MKIHFCSDLHLEINGKIDKAFSQMTGGDILLFGGDIACARHFAKDKTDADARSQQRLFRYLNFNVFPKYDEIYYIMGNHEHYGWDINDSKVTLQEYFDKNNYPVRILDNETVSLNEKYDLFASTLWTNFRNENVLDMQIVSNGMNDYKIIFNKLSDSDYSISKSGSYVLRASDTLAKFKETVSILEQSYNSLANDKNMIVLTHHAPSFRSEGSRVSSISAGYCSSLDEFILDRPRITHWIHGHTHNNVNYHIGNCNILTAMFGYKMYEPSLAKNFKIGEINI